MCRRKKKKRRSCFVASLLGVSAYLPPLEGFFYSRPFSFAKKRSRRSVCLCCSRNCGDFLGSFYRSRKRPETMVSDIERSPLSSSPTVLMTKTNLPLFSSSPDNTHPSSLPLAAGVEREDRVVPHRDTLPSPPPRPYLLMFLLLPQGVCLTADVAGWGDGGDKRIWRHG